MKKYILFKFDTYYPGGGMNDLSGSFDTIEKAKASAIDCDVFQIVDRDTWCVVFNSLHDD